VRQLIISALVILLFLSFLSSQAAAESTVNCHCFTDRSYDHQNPGKVVPYLLATTQNSFLAVAYNANKFNLVRALMNGVPAEQLWNLQYFSSRTGQSVSSLMKLHGMKGDWSAALSEVSVSFDLFSDDLQNALKTKNDKLIAAAIVDKSILQFLQGDVKELNRVRAAGADNREAILSFFLAKRIEVSAAQIFQSVKDKTTDWGTLAFTNNVQIDKMEQEFKRLMAE
jgi:hypothetical protein